MIYLIDSDALISANRKYYKMEHFPSFWTWLEKQFDLGVLMSVTNVQLELLKFSPNDPLKIWAQNNNGYFLSTSGQDDQSNLNIVATYVTQTYNQGRLRQNFINGADIYLIAKVMTLSNGGDSVSVVTNEQSAPNSTKKVKIPDVCRNFSIRTMTFFDFIYNQNINI